VTSQVSLFLSSILCISLPAALIAHHADQAFMQDVIAQHFRAPWREISPYENSVTGVPPLFCTSSLMVKR